MGLFSNIRLIYLSLILRLFFDTMFPQIQLHPFISLISMIVALRFNNSHGAYPPNDANCTYTTYRMSISVFCGIYFVIFFVVCVFHCAVLIVYIKWKGYLYGNCMCQSCESCAIEMMLVLRSVVSGTIRGVAWITPLPAPESIPALLSPPQCHA